MLNEVTLNNPLIKEVYVTKHAVISFIPSKQIAICSVTAAYIPISDFKAIFSKVGEMVKKENITKFIFDKRKMTVFHQPSMEWYHLNWKEDMYKVGLKKHRKLLPDDKLFEQSVITGRKKITRENPSFNYNKYDIMYCLSMEEAIEK